MIRLARRREILGGGAPRCSGNLPPPTRTTSVCGKFMRKAARGTSPMQRYSRPGGDCSHWAARRTRRRSLSRSLVRW